MVPKYGQEIKEEEKEAQKVMVRFKRSDKKSTEGMRGKLKLKID